jgi:hypothetical protein
MIYRKAPLQPPRLLLRIVAGAGAGVLLGTTACGSDTSGGVYGGVVMPGDAGSDAREAVVVTGLSPAPPRDAGDAGEEAAAVPFDDGGFLGVVVMPGGGIQPAPDDAGQMMTGLATDQ